MTARLSSSFILILIALPGANAIINDILNFVLSPLIGLLAQPICNQLLNEVDVLESELDGGGVTCECTGRFRGWAQLVGVASCEADSTLCFFNNQHCGDASMEVIVTPNLFGAWSLEGEGVFENVEVSGVPASSLDDDYRTYVVEVSLRDDFLLDDVTFSIGGESCKVVICDEDVPASQVFRRVLTDCSEIDLSGDMNLGIDGPSFLPNCPLDTTRSL